jgi:hypothetical protein
MTATEGPFQELLCRIGERLYTADRRTIAASFALRYGWSAGVAFAPYLLYACVPSITLGNVSFRFNEQGSFERAALHHPVGVMLSPAGVVPHPCVSGLSDPQALFAWLRRSLVEQAEPVVDALAAWSQFSVRGIWGMITSAWGSLCFHIFGEIGEQTQGLPWAHQFFAGTDVVAQMQPQFYPLTYRHVTHVHHRGASCCRYYRLRQGHYCASCPLISHEERLQRQHTWMKRLVDPQSPS